LPFPFETYSDQKSVWETSLVLFCPIKKRSGLIQRICFGRTMQLMQAGISGVAGQNVLRVRL
jgi:hypothetical protein